MFVRTICVAAFLTITGGVAHSQSLGQRAAAAVREQAVENALQRRGYNVDLSRQRGYYPQSNYYTRRPYYGYGGYSVHPSPFGYGYNVRTTPYGYGYGYGGYGYGGFGYNPGLYLHQFGSGNAGRGSSLGNRQNTPGSHYFGPPHASQYIPGNR